VNESTDFSQYFLTVRVTGWWTREKINTLGERQRRKKT
jgi:hypothetical protein